MLIEGVPGQFLSAHTPLLEEALVEAREFHYEQTPTRVLRAEHLVAIATQIDRAQDRERRRILYEQAEIDRPYLRAILARHHLEER